MKNCTQLRPSPSCWAELLNVIHAKQVNPIFGAYGFSPMSTPQLLYHLKLGLLISPDSKKFFLEPPKIHNKPNFDTCCSAWKLE